MGLGQISWSVYNRIEDFYRINLNSQKGRLTTSYLYRINLQLICQTHNMLSLRDVGQKSKLVANAQRVSSLPLVFIPTYYCNMIHETVSN